MKVKILRFVRYLAYAIYKIADNSINSTKNEFILAAREAKKYPSVTNWPLDNYSDRQLEYLNRRSIYSYRNRPQLNQWSQ